MDKKTQMWFGSQAPAQPAPAGVCPTCHGPAGDGLFCARDGTLLRGPFNVGDRYAVEAPIGAGGMALVFAARHLVLGKPVALKVLRPDLAQDAVQVQRFLREARTGSQLSHENIVAILDFGRDEALGLTYLVMERLQGRTLAEVIQREGPLDWKRVVPILVQVCRAISAAHAADVVHRDLTPRNVVLCQTSGRTDVVKLCDFGLSRLSSGRDRVTAAGDLLGTPAYMAPEQVRGAPDQDHRVDLYAVGAVAFEALTGRLPLEAPTPVALIAAKLADEVRPLRERFPDLALPPALDQLIAQCLARDPAKRPASALDVERALLGLPGDVPSAAATSSEIIGQTIGSYKVSRLLGSGGIGSVYLGEHPIIGTRAAIKVLFPEIAASEEAVARFIQEARASSEIGSPHIPRYFDFGKLPDGRPFAIMEFLDGQTLADRFARQGSLPLPEVAELISQLADALGQAHAAGIVHRDLKPENVMICSGDDGRPVVKVLDFGIAKTLQPSGSVAQTRVGIFMGTPAYCAPEQAFGAAVGPTADVYALGVMAFELLTGQLPFDGEAADMLAAKTSREAPPLAERRPDLPPRVAQAIAAMLRKDPAERPAEMSAIKAAVRGWSVADAPAVVEPELDAAVLTRGSRRRLVIAAGLVCAAALALWFAIGTRAPKPEPNVETPRAGVAPAPERAKPLPPPQAEPVTAPEPKPVAAPAAVLESPARVDKRLRKPVAPKPATPSSAKPKPDPRRPEHRGMIIADPFQE